MARSYIAASIVTGNVTVDHSQLFHHSADPQHAVLRPPLSHSDDRSHYFSRIVASFLSAERIISPSYHCCWQVLMLKSGIKMKTKNKVSLLKITAPVALPYGVSTEQEQLRHRNLPPLPSLLQKTPSVQDLPMMSGQHSVENVQSSTRTWMSQVDLGTTKCVQW